MASNELYDSVVIGAGPAGLTAALYLCRFGLKVALVEKLVPGGQVLNTFEVANYPGYPTGVAGWHLAENFALHLEGFLLDHFTQEVTSIECREGRHTIHLTDETLKTKTILITTGAYPRKLGLPGEERLTGKGISYCAMCDGMFFKDKVVALVGGGNAALEEALHLSHLVQKLYLIHRRDTFRADKIYQDKVLLRPDKITILSGLSITELHGENKLDSITIQPTGGGESRRLDIAGLFVFVGIVPANGFLPPEIETDAAGFIHTDAEMATKIPGIFAAGDIRSKQCRQVTTAVGDGATAAFAAFNYLDTL